MPDYSRHGHAGKPEYKSWQGMIQRCHNPNDTMFRYYGGRGISVCQEWRESFINFWCDMGEGYFPGATIERRHTDDGYHKGNCCWVPRSAQAKNRRTVPLIDTPWGRLTLPELAAKIGMSPAAMWQRWRKGSDLFATPVNKGFRVTPLTKEHLASLKGR